MYRIKLYNPNETITIQEPLNDDIKLLSAQIKKGINSFDSLDFSMLPNNPGINKIKNRQTLIDVVDSLTGEQLFWGQVLSPTDSMDADGIFNYDYICASGLSFLQDSIQNWYRAQNMTPEAFFRYLIDVHNQNVQEDFKKFVVGTVTVTNSTDNVYRFVDDTATTWETIMDKLVDRLGGVIVFRSEGGVNYVDYLQEGGEKVEGTTIQLTRNMITFSRNVDPTEVITVFKPRGARQDSGSDDYNASEPRLTISSVNGGVDYLLAPQALIDEFGYVQGSVAYDDITTPQALLTRGQQFLSQQKAALVKYTVSAADLSLLGMDTERFKVMNSYRTINKVFGVDEYLKIVGMTIDLVNPQVSSLTIGDKQKTLSQYQADMNKRNRELNNVSSTIQGLTTSFNREVTEINNEIITITNQIQQGDFEGIKESLENLQQDINNLVIPNYDVVNEVESGLMSPQMLLDLYEARTAEKYLLPLGAKAIVPTGFEPANYKLTFKETHVEFSLRGFTQEGDIIGVLPAHARPLTPKYFLGRAVSDTGAPTKYIDVTVATNGNIILSRAAGLMGSLGGVMSSDIIRMNIDFTRL